MKKKHWDDLLKNEKEKNYFKSIKKYIANERKKGKTIYPPDHQIFSAFTYTPFHTLKVVILGQDPYHGDGQAHGLSFSVPETTPLPPSLKNIFKALTQDKLPFEQPTHGSLIGWAKQGVLLLNTSLTVEANNAGSHANIGWQTFTDAVISVIDQHAEPVVFMLWGKHAQQKKWLINNPKHCILNAPHPSPLSAYRGFFSCQHFSKANHFLLQNQRTPIDWKISSVIS